MMVQDTLPFANKLAERGQGSDHQQRVTWNGIGSLAPHHFLSIIDTPLFLQMVKFHE
jgi:hypothetical protein